MGNPLLWSIPTLEGNGYFVTPPPSLESKWNQSIRLKIAQAFGKNFSLWRILVKKMCSLIQFTGFESLTL